MGSRPLQMDSMRVWLIAALLGAAWAQNPDYADLATNFPAECKALIEFGQPLPPDANRIHQVPVFTVHSRYGITLRCDIALLATRLWFKT